MGCPQCQSDEISPSGVCLLCGYKTEADPSVPEPHAEGEEAQGYSGMIEMDYAEGTPDVPEKPDIPQWRKELSNRLHEIQQKREAASHTESKRPLAPVAPAKPLESPSAVQARLLEKMPVRKPQPQLAPPPRQKTLEPLEPQPSAKPADPGQIRNLIDNAVSRQIPQTSAPPDAVEHAGYMAARESGEEGKLILLSRTLSGLVDLIVIVLCTGVCLIAADHFYGIVVLDQISLFHFALLFLLNYFLYSFYFLSTSNQTIGMMITDLRVVAAGEKRPSTRQILSRCCMYLVSLFGLCIGLISGLFNRENLCFHDRYSRTYIVRI